MKYNVICKVVIQLILAATSAWAQTIPNPSFEANSFTVFPGYASGNGGSIVGWTVSPATFVGLNPASSSPFADNGKTPAGTNVAFIQSYTNSLSTLSTTITGLTPGTAYQVTFRSNARAAGGITGPTWSINNSVYVPFTAGPAVGGTNEYYTNNMTFTATNTTAALVLANQSTDDSTVLVDDFRINALPSQGDWKVYRWTDDRSTGLDPVRTLWAYHFNSPAMVPVNGLGVLGLAGTNAAVPGRFSVAGANLAYNGEVNNLTTKPGLGSSVMAQNFIYNGNPNTITLQGLTIGQKYIVSFFSVAFEGQGNRFQNFASGSDYFLVDQDAFGNDNGIRVDYTFTAAATNRVITITPSSAPTLHLFGLALRVPQLLTLNGSPSLTNECHYPYADPGAYSGPTATSGGYFYNLALKSDSTVVAWGDNYFRQTNVPPGLSNVVAISAGADFALALKNDATVIAWGTNDLGQTNIPLGLINVAAISAGSSHTLALKNDGTIIGWGYNAYRQTNVPPGLSNVVAISAGGAHSLALKNDGTVVAWGDNFYRQTNVPPGLSNVVAISAGSTHSLALKIDGTVIGWGYNNFGQTNVPPGLSNVVAISAGGNVSSTLNIDGTVTQWGDNTYGQTIMPAGLSNVVTITTGYFQSLAIKTDGTVTLWGDNVPSQTNLPPSIYIKPIVSGSVDTNSLGTYPLTYVFPSLSGSPTLSRTVTVVDTTPPAISLNGPNPLILTTRNYTEPGATALDLCGGSYPVTITNRVNVNFPGTYTNTYTSSDSYGNTATISRVISVALPPAVPGDLNGDGIVDQSELNQIYANYATNSPFLLMTNVVGLGGTNVTFALSNDVAGGYTVQYSTDLVNWTNLGTANPRYLFIDTNAPAGPQRYYRLRYP